MEKKVLIITSVASMIDQFIIPSIKLLQSMGYDVDVATNFEKGSTCTIEKIIELKETLFEMNVDAYHIDFDRKITNVKGVINAIKQINEVLNGVRLTIHGTKKHNSGNYKFIHCHSPIGGVVGRLVGKKNKLKTIYTAHGFHFYKGSPIKNWLMFYPVEWILSWLTDILITINKEDYIQSIKHLHAKKTYYVPGIGIDIEKYKSNLIIRDKKRAELGFSSDDFLIFSVGELNDNKNHQIIINAIGDLVSESPESYKKIHYIIAGKGELAEKLETSAADRNINNQIHLIGFRTDISELQQATDIFALPSKREGLNVSLMEAIACGKYCLASNIRGNQDLVIDDEIGLLVDSLDLKGWKDGILYAINRRRESNDSKRREIIQMISSENVLNNLKEIYSGV